MARKERVQWEIEKFILDWEDWEGLFLEVTIKPGERPDMQKPWDRKELRVSKAWEGSQRRHRSRKEEWQKKEDISSRERVLSDATEQMRTAKRPLDKLEKVMYQDQKMILVVFSLQDRDQCGQRNQHVPQTGVQIYSKMPQWWRNWNTIGVFIKQ